MSISCLFLSTQDTHKSSRQQIVHKCFTKRLRNERTFNIPFPPFFPFLFEQINSNGNSARVHTHSLCDACARVPNRNRAIYSVFDQLMDDDYRIICFHLWNFAHGISCGSVEARTKRRNDVFPYRLNSIKHDSNVCNAILRDYTSRSSRLAWWQ